MTTLNDLKGYLDVEPVCYCDQNPHDEKSIDKIKTDRLLHRLSATQTAPQDYLRGFEAGRISGMKECSKAEFAPRADEYRDGTEHSKVISDISAGEFKPMFPELQTPDRPTVDELRAYIAKREPK